MVCFAMLALFADEDYEEVAGRLTETLESWDAGMTRGARRPQGSPGPAVGLHSGTTLRRKRPGVDLGPPLMWMLAP